VPVIPHYKSNPPPEYPAIARRRGYEGRVLLSATISIEGNVAGLKVKESSGHPVLDRAAMKAVEAWEFEPARRMGSPVPNVGGCSSTICAKAPIADFGKREFLFMRRTVLKVILLFVSVLLFFAAEAYCASSKTFYLQGDKYLSRKNTTRR